MAEEYGMAVKVPMGINEKNETTVGKFLKSTAPNEQKEFILKPMPKYNINHRALQLATRHRICSATMRRPRTAGVGSVIRRTVPHRRSRSRLSASSVDGMEADMSKSQTTESDWLDILDHDDYDYDAEDEPIALGPMAAALEKENQCQKMYRAACRAEKIAPASTVIRCLPEKEIAVKHHIMGPIGAKALAIALCHNGTVEKLDLQENELGPLGTSYICEMFSENEFITDLCLTENKLGSEGAKVICKLLSENENICKLKLAGNGFQEYDAEVFLEMLRKNYTLKELDLSHNDFSEKGAEILAKAIADNTSLETFNLSWNHIRNKGAAAIGKALTHNIGLKVLNLGWNGLHLLGCKALGRALATNNSLLRLDLSCNRIDKECLDLLLLGIRKNTCLTAISLNQNPIGNEGAMDILECVGKTKEPALKEINISSVSINVDFKKKKRDLAEAGCPLYILHGHLVRRDEAGNLDEEEIFLNDDPMMVLMEFMRLKNLRLLDLFSSMDKDASGTLTRDEFRDGLLRANVPLSADALNRLIKKLDKDRDGEVDFGELIQGWKDHKKKVSNMKRIATERGLTFEQTEIGRVSMKLHSLLNITFRRAVRPLTSVQTAIRNLRGSTDTDRPARPRTVGIMRTGPGGLLSPYNISASDLPGFSSTSGSRPSSASPANSRPQSGRSIGSSAVSASQRPKPSPKTVGNGKLAWGLRAK